MQLQLRHSPVGGHQHPYIAHNGGVHTHLVHLGQVPGQQIGLLIVQQGVAGQVKALAHLVGQLHRLGQLLLGKAPGPRAHVKELAAQIYRVRPKAQCRLQPFPVARRRQDLRFVFYHSVRFPLAYSFIWMERPTSSAFSSPCSAASRYSAKVSALPAPFAVMIFPSCCKGAAV